MTYIAHPYNGVHTFLNAPLQTTFPTDKVKMGFLGVPFTEGVSNRPGANFGPNAIRAASKMLCEGIDDLVDLNDVQLIGSSIEVNLKLIESAIIGLTHLNIYPLIAGGDHTITLAILRAMKAKYGRVRLIHFDAHPDTFFDVFGKQLGHGTFVRNAIEEELIDGEKSMLIGVRCPMSEDVWDFTNSNIGTVITAGEVHDYPKYRPEAIAALIGSDSITPTYLTLDIDVLDPTYAPGTGTPEIAGLSTHQMKSIIGHFMMKRVNWIGMDVVEVSPPYDHAEITSLAAATFMYIHGLMVRDKL